MTTSISNHFDLKNESVEQILSENGFEEKNLIVMALGYKKTGYGHWQLECEIAKQDNYSENIILKLKTTNSNLIDDWGEDEEYFKDNNSGHCYDSNSIVMETAFDFIISSEFNQQKIYEFINL
jgi:hypothetical protein